VGGFDKMVERNDREEALVREEASHRMLRESIDLNKQMIARSEQLLGARPKPEPPNPVAS
jgi:hypothetical protein